MLPIMKIRRRLKDVETAIKKACEKSDNEFICEYLSR